MAPTVLVRLALLSAVALCLAATVIVFAATESFLVIAVDDQRAELWELRTDADEVTLRDAHSSGFAVELDDGRRLVVP